MLFWSRGRKNMAFRPHNEMLYLNWPRKQAKTSLNHSVAFLWLFWTGESYKVHSAPTLLVSRISSGEFLCWFWIRLNVNEVSSHGTLVKIMSWYFADFILPLYFNFIYNLPREPENILKGKDWKFYKAGEHCFKSVQMYISKFSCILKQKVFYIHFNI